MVARGGGSLPEATAVKRRLRALAVEPAEEIRGGAVPLFRVAFQTAGDEVGVGIAPQLDARHDMVEGAHEGGKVAQTVKAEATLARVDGRRRTLVFMKSVSSRLAARGRGAGARCPNLVGQAHLDHVTGFGAIDQAQSAVVDEAAYSVARGVV